MPQFYTKKEVDQKLAEVLEEAREIDRLSMEKHNWTATVISMILGCICLALFVDGLLRILGIIPPFMDLDVSIVDEVVERVEKDVIPLIKQAKGYIPGI